MLPSGSADCREAVPQTRLRLVEGSAPGQEGTTVTTGLAKTVAVAALYLVVQLAALYLVTSLLVTGLF